MKVNKDNALGRIISEFFSDKKNLVISVLAIFILFFGGYAVTGYFTADIDTVEPIGNDPVGGDITTFIDSGKEIELVNGKPVIRLFSTTWCPHCKWITETYERVVQEYVDDGKIIAYHWELDIKDNTLTPEPENSVPESENAVFKEFNQRGSIPTFVFGGKYYRIGNGYERAQDLAAEEAEFRAVIEKLLEEAS